MPWNGDSWAVCHDRPKPPPGVGRGKGRGVTKPALRKHRRRR